MEQSKIFEILAAGALGDAFGYAIEFDSWRSIQEKFGEKGLTVWPYHPTAKALIASDDTQMTIFGLEAIRRSFDQAMSCGDATLRKEVVVEQSKNSYLRWYRSQQYRRQLESSGLLSRDEIWARRAPGNTCLSALSAIANHRDHQNDSKGCGAVMRAAPFAILLPEMNDHSLWELSAEQGYITHQHIDGCQSAAAMSYILSKIPTTNDELIQAARDASLLCSQNKALGTAKCIDTALAFKDQHLDPEQLCINIGEGWVGDEALGVGLWAALRTTNVTEAIILGANHRGDSDSTASIAAQFSACMHGLDAKEWMAFDRVDLSHAMKDELHLLETTTKLWAHRHLTQNKV